MAFFGDTISHIFNSLGHLGNTAMELPGRCLRNSRRENEQDAETREAVINPYLIGGAVFVLGLGLTGCIPQPVVSVVKTVLRSSINAGAQVLSWASSWF